ncbi:TPA: hypothetical protein DEP21_01075 [Patescibacteria group bacterium]|nr:hypothetical protein [Candidatus Gracilibacteria bacterium]
MSGTDQLLTGYTYSGSDLTITLSGGSAGLGNAGTYVVQFYPKWDMPANATVSITGVALDLAGNIGTLSTSYTTRPDCSYFGCSEVLGINILGGTSAGSYLFSGALLVVTGTNPNSPYPYLTGVNNDTVMCGLQWNGAQLTGNVSLYNSNNDSINGTTYTGNTLYITGLNFTIVNGVIVIE